MKQWFASFSAACILFMLPLSGDETPPPAQQVAKIEVEKVETAKLEKTESLEPAAVDHLLISEALGHLVCENLLKSLEAQLDTDRLIKGIKDAMSGMPNPLSEEQTVEAIQHFRDQAFQKVAKENLEKAQAFLDFNAKNSDVNLLEAGKIQYVILQKGEGAAVEEHSNPMIKYQARFLDGQVFGESKNGETIALDETFPGFSIALKGMKVGEKRLIHIHPDLGYGGNGVLPPNSLLTFEVEIMKAHVPEEKLDTAKNIADTELLDPVTLK